MAARRASRLGRPPASSSAETRQRILDSARRSFADLGYEAATNRRLAAGAGITTGALYHYFDAKLDLYRAVYEDTQELVYRRFGEAQARHTTFLAKLSAVLDVAVQLNVEDPSLARFLGAVRVDAARYPDLAEALHGSVSPVRRRGQFFAEMIEAGVRSGEIDASQAAAVHGVLTAALVGLSDALSHDAAAHRRAADSLKLLFEGKLIHPEDPGKLG